MEAALTDIAPFAWPLLAFCAMLVGISKTALPGINTIAIAVFAAVLPAKASTGILLILLIIGDIFALLTYRRHADWKILVRLIPAVIVGVAAGTVFLALADDSAVRRVIGVILLLVIGFTLWRRTRSSGEMGDRAAKIASAGYGSLGGFTTMVANSGGPVMSMYFLAARLPVRTFLGTAAWFFAVINIVKVPISAGLGLITFESLLIDLILAPGVIIGAFVGIALAKRIKQQVFEWVVIVFTTVGALYLLIF